MAEKKQKEKTEKPLDKWTVKELREEALKVPDVQGVHGMNREELIAVVREEKGITAPEKKKNTTGVREMKAKILEMRAAKEQERAQGATRDRLNILRRKICRMKRLTRSW
ncbi:MAG: transcription termination factor Rho [Pseudomonadota bacterium]